jgi:hypothetical protein
MFGITLGVKICSDFVVEELLCMKVLFKTAVSRQRMQQTYGDD